MTFPIAFAYPWYLLLLLALGPVAWLWRRGHNPFRRWREGVSLALRVGIVTLAVLSLAGIQWVRASDELAVVFLLDVSDSIDAQAQEQALAAIRAALAEMGPDDRAALVLFGDEALVERPLSAARELGALFSIPSTAGTDVGEAVRLGLALLPPTARRRLVLLSDGQVTVAGAEAAVQLAAAGGVELYTVPLPARGGEEAWIDALEVPRTLYEGESFGAVVRVRSLVSQGALLRLYEGDTLAAEEAVALHPGINSFAFDLSAQGPGFNTYAVQLIPERDVFYQNNVLGAFALVEGAPTVLVVAQPPYEDQDSGLTVDEAEGLVLALESAGLRVERTTHPYLPADLTGLGEYASLVLVNIPASALSPRQMAVIQSYVRDLGRGLVCVGGEESYGVGGYFRTPLEETLPVEMAIRDRERMPPLAIAFVIDKSGSMGMSAGQGGASKIDLAKEAVLRSLELLNPSDRVGVIAFEGTAQWVWPSGGDAGTMAELADVTAVQQEVMTLRAGGGTDIYAGLSAAVTALGGSDARLKHVILLTDGGASQEGLSELAARLRADGGTLSTVGVGQDAASFLQPLALDGGGRYHYTDNPSTIPQIFVQETTLAQRAYIVEETFYPTLVGRSPILEGIAAVPALYGYVATSAKPAARTVLVSGQDDPLLAQWQYGLGRAVAWTSDAKGQWAREWVRWEQFPRFWGQAVRWTIAERDETGLEVQIAETGGQARAVVDVVQETGEYGNDLQVTLSLISPALEMETVPLRQTAPGRYEGTFSPREEGIYLARVVAQPPGGSDIPSLHQVMGYVRPYSPEYRAFGTDEVTLGRLAEIGGGALIADLAADPGTVFARGEDEEVVRTYDDVWPWLLGAAVCLLPLDVGLRRVTFDLGDLRRAAAWIRSRLNGLRRGRAVVRPSERATSPTGRLMAAKRRAPVSHDEREQHVPIDRASVAPPQVGGAGAPPAGVELPPPPVAADRAGDQDGPAAPTPLEPAGAEEGTMTARLLAAKRRAQRREESE